MNKELTPLEALENIIGCSTIESHTQKWQKDYYIVEKSLKVLEIIIRKNVDTYALKIFWRNNVNDKDTLTLYNQGCLEGNELTQQEYDLLKEVLL